MSSSDLAPSKGMLWTSWFLSGCFILFMVFDSVVKLIKIQPVIDAFAQLGYPDRLALHIGIVELTCTALYAIPRTAVLGAVLLTAVMGGAIASHVRVGDPMFSHVLFGVYLALFMWGGLYLRDARLRAVFPLRS